MNAILDALPQGGDLSFDGGLRVRWASGKPVCPACETPLPTSEIPVGLSGNVHCPQCGHACSTTPPPNWMRGASLAAKQLYLVEAQAGDCPSAAPDVTTAVVVTCPNCGGSVSVGDQSARTVPCNYCRVDVFLPDAVWRRLHPVSTSTTWFVRFEGLSAQEREQEKRVKKLLARVVARA